MAPKRKKVWKRDESAKAARRARSERENERNAIANAKRRIENIIHSKFESKRAFVPCPTAMNKEVESSPLVKAMEHGFLDDLKIFGVKDHKFLIPTLLNSSNVYVPYIIHGLEGYLNSIVNDELEKARVERVLHYFEGNFVSYLVFFLECFMSSFFIQCNVHSFHCFLCIIHIFIFCISFFAIIVSP